MQRYYFDHFEELMNFLYNNHNPWTRLISYYSKYIDKWILEIWN